MYYPLRGGLASLRLARVCSLVICLLAIGSPGSSAQSIPDMRGSWAGFGQSSTMESSFFDVFFDVSVQDGTQIRMDSPGWGIRTGILSMPLSFQGMVDGRGIVNARAMGRMGESVELNGPTRIYGDGSVRFLALRYLVRNAMGEATDRGFVVVIQRLGGMDWATQRSPNVIGRWSGNWMSRMRMGAHGMADSSVDWQLGSGFSGDLSFFKVSVEQDIHCKVQGTIGAPIMMMMTSELVPAVHLAANARGEVAILIGMLHPADMMMGTPPTFRGKYNLFNSFFDVFTELSNPKMGKAFDRGAYELPAVQ